MTSVDVLKNAVENVGENPETLDGHSMLTEPGCWFPKSFLDSLLLEIEELEERCGELYE